MKIYNKYTAGVLAELVRIKGSMEVRKNEIKF